MGDVVVVDGDPGVAGTTWNAQESMPANRAAASGLGQANGAAERSAHVARAAGCEVVLPCVEVSPGVWKLRVLVEAEVENARLRAEVVALRADLAMARAREGATGLEYRGG